MRSRSVLCIKDDQIVGDSLCLDSNNVESTKPITLEKCELKDVSYCKPKWHYSEWSEVNSIKMRVKEYFVEIGFIATLSVLDDAEKEHNVGL